MRWEIETAFRELKYTIRLNAFHAKKRKLIKQEIYARLILHNFCERIKLTLMILKSIEIIMCVLKVIKLL
ncbi:transposase [Thomasclavelia spiroformis]|uniref:transposase n=1 Tax=Thomasclavelia spiroformis TaxID=29348 RepID=UPI003C6FE7EE|nr:transposase [Thomasclavelia spiroformis]